MPTVPRIFTIAQAMIVKPAPINHCHMPNNTARPLVVQISLLTCLIVASFLVLFTLSLSVAFFILLPFRPLHHCYSCKHVKGVSDWKKRRRTQRLASKLKLLSKQCRYPFLCHERRHRIFMSQSSEDSDKQGLSTYVRNILLRTVSNVSDFWNYWIWTHCKLSSRGSANKRITFRHEFPFALSFRLLRQLLSWSQKQGSDGPLTSEKGIPTRKSIFTNPTDSPIPQFVKSQPSIFRAKSEIQANTPISQPPAMQAPSTRSGSAIKPQPSVFLSVGTIPTGTAIPQSGSPQTSDRFIDKLQSRTFLAEATVPDESLSAAKSLLSERHRLSLSSSPAMETSFSIDSLHSSSPSTEPSLSAESSNEFD